MRAPPRRPRTASATWAMRRMRSDGSRIHTSRRRRVSANWEGDGCVPGAGGRPEPAGAEKEAACIRRCGVGRSTWAAPCMRRRARVMSLSWWAASLFSCASSTASRR